MLTFSCVVYLCCGGYKYTGAELEEEPCVYARFIVAGWNGDTWW